MAGSVCCYALPSKFGKLTTLNNPSSFYSSSSHNLLIYNNPFTKSLSFSANTTSHYALSTGFLSMSPVIRTNRGSIVCEAAPTKKADSAAKRARQAEKRRIYNKSHKSEVRTRMKKALEAIEVLRKKPDAQQDEVLSIEKLIAEAYSVIDKAVKVGTLHRNTGARRKSRLARRKKAVEIHHGWYTPSAAPSPVV